MKLQSIIINDISILMLYAKIIVYDSSLRGKMNNNFVFERNVKSLGKYSNLTKPSTKLSSTT